MWGVRYPMWFDEGFAEYLSAARTHFEYFEIGLVPEHRRGSLIYSSWISMRKILSPGDYDRWGDERKAMFYAEAWALVHYLQNRSDRDTSFGQDMGHYVELVESGESDIEAFEEAFGMTVKDLNWQVKRYLERGRFPGFRMKLDQLLPDFEPEVTSLSREQASLGLGQIALRRGALDKADHWFNDRRSRRGYASVGRGWTRRRT